MLYEGFIITECIYGAICQLFTPLIRVWSRLLFPPSIVKINSKTVSSTHTNAGKTALGLLIRSIMNFSCMQ